MLPGRVSAAGGGGMDAGSCICRRRGRRSRPERRTETRNERPIEHAVKLDESARGTFYGRNLWSFFPHSLENSASLSISLITAS